MKQRNKILIYIGLGAITVLATLFGLKMYMQNSELVNHIEKQVPIFVAKNKINKGDIVKSSDFKQTLLPKSYVGFVPLTPAEIVGKYASVTILAGEPFRSEKLSYEAIEEEVLNEVITPADVECIVEDKLAENNDTITLALTIFRNIDFTLKNGDFIDILGIKQNQKTSNISAKYSAVHVKIASFVKDGNLIEAARVQVKNSETGLSSTTFADSIVIEMKPNQLENFLTLYYKSQPLNKERYFNKKNENIGHLWMIRSSKDIDPLVLQEKSKMLLDYKKVVKKQRAKKKRVRKASSKVLITYEN